MCYMGWEAEHMSMLQIGILGVAGVLLALQFKSGKSEYGIYISIVLGLADLCLFDWKDQTDQRCAE